MIAMSKLNADEQLYICVGHLYTYAENIGEPNMGGNRRWLPTI